MPGYPLSYRDLEEIFRELGFEVNNGTINRCVLAYGPVIEKRLRLFRYATRLACPLRRNPKKVPWLPKPRRGLPSECHRTWLQNRETVAPTNVAFGLPLPCQ